MNKIYKISVYKVLTLQFILNFLVLILSLGGIVYASQHSEYRNIILIISLFALLICLTRLIQLFLLLSYKLILTPDGQLIESQILYKDRNLNLSSISQIKWGIVGALPGLGQLLFAKEGGSIADMQIKIFNRPANVGFFNFYGWGLQIINSSYSPFPRYAINSDLANDIKTQNPNILIDKESLEHAKNIQERRYNALKWGLIILIVFVILMGLWIWMTF